MEEMREAAVLTQVSDKQTSFSNTILRGRENNI